MNPYVLLTLIMTGIVGGLAAGAYLGHKLDQYLGRTKPTGRSGRIVRDYRLWTVLGALLMCAAIMTPAVVPDAFLVAFGLMSPMVFCFVLADGREPRRKSCKTCGH